MTRQLASIYRDLVPSRQFIVTQNLSSPTGTGKKLANPDTLRFALGRLPAPNYTTEPLYLRCALTDNDRKTEVIAVIKMGENPPQVSFRRDLQTALRCFSGDWKVLNGWEKSPVERIR
jgi:hypothetical protein